MLKIFEVIEGFHYGPTDPSVSDFHAQPFRGAQWKKGPSGELTQICGGQLIQSEHDLDKTFPQKFRRYIPPVAQTVLSESPDPSAVPPSPLQQRQSRTVSPSQPTPTTASVTADDADDAGPVGKDVTTSYPSAMEQDYKVYLHRGQCTLYDGDDLAKGITKPLNVNPVPTNQVDKVVAKLLRAQPV